MSFFINFHSDQDSSSSTIESSSSDEEFMLASNNPKNRAGRKKFRETGHPVYRGVRQRDSAKWVCEVREPDKNSRIWLGTFATVKMAAIAHDVAALALRRRSACLNFADSAWRLPVPASTDAKDIQKVAKAFGQPNVEPEEAVALDFSADMSPENVYFADEEVLFGMPGLIDNMAEGLMMQPPPSRMMMMTCAHIFTLVFIQTTN